MKIFKLTALKILVLLVLVSCMQEYTPAISYQNISKKKIYNLKGTRGEYYLRGRDELWPGGGLTQNFAIDSKSDFFSPVHLEWKNAAGKKFTKDFVFKKEELPTYLLMDWQKRRIREKNNKEGGNILGDKTYARVEFYFDQDGLVYYTSDHPDIEKITKRYRAQEEKNKRIFMGLDK